VDALVVGLGNPGRRYASTRHNVGYMVVEHLRAQHGGAWRDKYQSRFCTVRVADREAGLLAPETYVNLAGQAVAAAARAARLAPADVIVVYDDIELAFDRVRVRAGGGLKGHNGLRSIATSLGSPEFIRVRCGVGRPRPGDPRAIADYVLAPFYEDEDAAGMVTVAAEAVEAILTRGLDEALRLYP
jgi:peptidyl-tRNA hydrolase, PTH1 family